MLRFKKAPRHFFGGAFFIFTLLFGGPAHSAVEKKLTPFQISVLGWQKQFTLHDQSHFHIEDHGTALPIESPLIHGKLEAALNLQSKPSELVVFVPGTYGGVDAVEITRFAETLFEKGYSTLRLSNPLSTHYVDAQTSFPGLDFQSEADVYVDFIKKVQKEHSFTRLHFLGVSYGALTCAIMAHDYGPGFNGHVLLISPPKNLLTSLTIIDHYFDKLKDEAAPIPWDHIWQILRLKWDAYWGRSSYVEPQLARNMLFLSGFHLGFRKVVAKLNDRNSENWFSQWSTSHFPITQWPSILSKEQLSLRFVPYIKKMNPQFFTHLERQDIMYWLKPIPGQWEVFSSYDEYINDPKDKWPSSPHVHMYEDGGHVFGIMGRENFIETIDKYLK
jgi:pimeloyl-ACP methyl ester carboxylesterase